MSMTLMSLPATSTISDTTTAPTVLATPSTSLNAFSSMLHLSNASGSSSSLAFVGNSPSAVLFFFAIALGVGIPCLFIFFTVRYFVRFRYGFHGYTVSGRGDAPDVNYHHYSNREIREHLQYLRNHHYIRDEYLERQIFLAARRRRRGRFSKMKKLTASEVEDLFPKATYADWLASGLSDRANKQLTELASSVEPKSSAVAGDRTDVIELHHLNVSNSGDENDDPDHVFAYITEQSNDKTARSATPHDHSDGLSLAVEQYKVHFDLGSCAICLDMFEAEDVVRGLLCGHVYHSDCLDPWLTWRRACCPICKRDYYKEASGSGEARAGNVIESAYVHDNQSAVASHGANNETADASDTADTETASAGNTGGLDILTEELNYEYVRRDSQLQALFNELIPSSERVRVILEEHPDMNLEARARETAARKCHSVWRVWFWRLMGISQEDLYHWAVLDIYQSSQRQSNGDTRTGDEEQTNGQNSGGRRAAGGENGEADVEMTETGVLRPADLATPYGNELTEIDVSETAHRDAVSRGV
ncbi:hypothetical protein METBISCDRAFT_21376 [Metschnikowia bicuspidata]|uniref:RING-type domain-containing protein n=1 Tax=Metschnikowia bicuspidata TaxID=27322 RepID=A0A4P9ZGZ4_9ASCO|nr:hypothetical protein METBISCDRAFT_21376 [Metschnikowia bicuspidata]